MRVSNIVLMALTTEIARQPVPAARIRDGDERSGETVRRYVRVAYQSLAVFRFVSFAMGAGLLYALHPEEPPGLALVLMMLAVGLISILWVAYRFDPPRYRQGVRRALVGIDVTLALALVLMSDGLDSPFLISSLSPTLTAGLIMGPRTALGVAAASAASVTAAHIASGFWAGPYPRLLTGNYLAFSLLYAAICLIIAYLPFVANLNWHLRLRADSREVERQRLRREVQDNVAQTLAFLTLKMRRAEEKGASSGSPLTARDIEDIGGAVQDVYLRVRDYLDGSDQEYIEAPLAQTLSALAERWGDDTGLDATVALSGEEGRVPPNIKFQLLQIAREALANVAKHAGGSGATLELASTPSEIRMRIKDDGSGLAAHAPRGHGMDIMRQRAALVGASLSVTSSPEEGTGVIVTWPRDAEMPTG